MSSFKLFSHPLKTVTSTPNPCPSPIHEFGKISQERGTLLVLPLCSEKHTPILLAVTPILLRVSYFLLSESPFFLKPCA